MGLFERIAEMFNGEPMPTKPYNPTLINQSQARAQAYERSQELGEWFDALVKHRDSMMDQCNLLKQQLSAYGLAPRSAQLGQANQIDPANLFAQKQYAQQMQNMRLQAMAQANQGIQGATWASSGLQRYSGLATLTSTGSFQDFGSPAVGRLPEPKDDRVIQMVEDYKKDCEVK